MGGTDNLKAYELYLTYKGQTYGVTAAEYSRALETIDEAIALDPKFALAWAAKSNIHVYLSIWGSTNNIATEQNAAQIAALKAIELEPDLAEGYVSLGSIKTIKGDFIEAQSAFSKALNLITEPLSGDELPIGINYFALGYFKRAQELLEKIRQNDPLQPDGRYNYMLCLAFMGNIKGAEEEYNRCKALFGQQWPLDDAYITLIRLGTDMVSRDKIIFSNPIYDATKEYMDSPQKGLTELRRIYSNNDNFNSGNFMDISIWAAYFGDLGFAMEAMEKGISINGAGVWHIWLPIFREVRQTPRFKEFIRDIGLVDYWNEFGWPDLCRPLDNGDFVCD